MSTYEELRQVVEEVRDDPERRDMSRIIEHEYSQARFEGFGEWDRARLVAHHLHAAGYRKPQQVTTTSELEALPVGSVLKDRVGDIYERVENPDSDRPVWRVPGIRGYLVTASVLLPATVLHVGGES